MYQLLWHVGGWQGACGSALRYAACVHGTRLGLVGSAEEAGSQMRGPGAAGMANPKGGGWRGGQLGLLLPVSVARPASPQVVAV